MPSGLIVLLLASFGIIVFLVLCPAYFYYGRLWFKSRVASAEIPIMRLVRMSFNGVVPHKIVYAYMDAVSAKLPVELDKLEEYARARVDVREVVRGMRAAKKSGVEVGLEEACAIHLRGKDIPEEVSEIS